MKVLLTAFGHLRYGEWAWNLAKSIGYYTPEAEVILVHDDKSVSSIDLKPFHKTINIKTPLKDGKLHPATVKLSLDKWVEDEAIYIDCDSVVIQDLKPLFEKCRKTGKDYLVEVQDWKEEGEEFKKMLWAGDDMWEHFGVERIPATNSSFQYLKKSKEVTELFKKARWFLDNMQYDYKKAPHKWGSDPDELYLNVAIADLGIDPTFPTPVHYPVKHSEKLTELWNLEKINDTEDLKKYFILSFAGDGRNISRFGKEIYNKTMANLLKKHGLPHVFKIELLLKRKFIR